MQSGVFIVNIPYRGTAPAIADVLAGQVELMFAAVGNAQAQVRAGKLKALGVTSARRLPAFPDVPAIAEVLPGYESSAWFGLFGPARMPAELARRTSDAARQAAGRPRRAAPAGDGRRGARGQFAGRSSHASCNPKSRAGNASCVSPAQSPSERNLPCRNSIKPPGAARSACCEGASCCATRRRCRWPGSAARWRWRRTRRAMGASPGWWCPSPRAAPPNALARLAADALAAPLGQRVVVDNKGGAGGGIAAEMVARAPADGNTLLVAGQGLLFINKALYKKLSYDPDADFVYVGMLGSFPNVVVAHPRGRAGADACRNAGAGAQPARAAQLRLQRHRARWCTSPPKCWPRRPR